MHTPISRYLPFIAAFFVYQSISAAPVYKHVDAGGTITYTDTPPAGISVVKSNIRAKTPGLEDVPVSAAAMIYATEVLVETSYRFCRDEIPSSASAVKAARDKWMDQHASLRAKKIEVAHDLLTMDELMDLAAQMKRDNEKVLAVLKAAPFQQRVKMCTDAPTKFLSPEMNLMAHPTLVKTIMDYQVKH